MTTENELIVLHLIEGMHDPTFKHKLLEMLQSVNLTVERACVATGINKKYNQQLNEGEVYSKNKYEILCKYCSERHVREKNNCPAFGKTCSICKRKIHAPKVCRYKKNVEELKDTQVDRGGAENFTLNTPTKTREKVKINGKYFHMQVDTDTDITLIQVNF